MKTATTFSRIPFIHKAKYYSESQKKRVKYYSVMYQEKDALPTHGYMFRSLDSARDRSPDSARIPFYNRSKTLVYFSGFS